VKQLAVIQMRAARRLDEAPQLLLQMFDGRELKRVCGALTLL